MVIDKLIDKIIETSNPTVVGLDPRIEYIPKFIIDEKYEKYGYTPKAVAEAIYMFNKFIIDEIYDLIPAIKPQIAMYEQYGLDGLEAYIKTTKYAKDKGLIVIGDIKRGDISSTAEAYSDAHIGQIKIKNQNFSMFDTDFVTINPYMGSDSINPFLRDCKEYERGLFILAKTSNPSSGEIQDLLVDGIPIYEKVGHLITEWGSSLIGKNGYSEVGAVVGATYKEQAKKLRDIMPNTFFLVPGYGAQGGKAEDLAVCFDKNGLGAIVNSSRGIIANHLNKEFNNLKDEEFAKASREAVISMRDDLKKYI